MGASWKGLPDALVMSLLLTAILLAANPTARAQQPEQPAASPGTQNPPVKPRWLYGGFADFSYALDFNHPSNHLFRSRGTTPRVDEAKLNMAALYLRKDASEQSRWGMELTVQGGEDSKIFGYSATAPNFPGGNWLRHLGPTNVSYLAPVGRGLAIQGGYFNSFIGYDSLYAKNNFNYTRPWGADFTPFLMFGGNAAYPFNVKLTGALFVVNGYWHLANANGAPSFGGQLAFKPTSRVTVKETLLFGPHQSNTSYEFWRTLSDSIAEWKEGQVTAAFEYQISSERVDAPGRPRALWMSAQLPLRWTMNNRWSVAFRPEVAWDRDGRWTQFRQTVKAVTSTLEYRFAYWRTNTILRLEHRWDDSRGPDGGFFRGREIVPGAVGLTPAQHFLIFGVILALNSPSQP